MTTADDDAVLVARARAGDEAAFAALVDRHAGPVLNFVRRSLFDRSEAEDVAQEVFVKTWRGLPAYRETGAKFSTWLFSIARNAAIDRARARARREAVSLDAQVADAGPGPDEQAERAELGEAIARAAARLPEDQRTAFLLSEYHQQPVREIAAVMSCSEKAVENRLYRARQFLRRELAAWVRPRGG